MEGNGNVDPKCKAHGTFALGWSAIWLHLVSYLLKDSIKKVLKVIY